MRFNYKKMSKRTFDELSSTIYANDIQTIRFLKNIYLGCYEREVKIKLKDNTIIHVYSMKLWDILRLIIASNIKKSSKFMSQFDEMLLESHENNLFDGNFYIDHRKRKTIVLKTYDGDINVEYPLDYKHQDIQLSYLKND